jgi:hypothetical protein
MKESKFEGEILIFWISLTLAASKRYSSPRKSKGGRNKRKEVRN